MVYARWRANLIRPSGEVLARPNMMKLIQVAHYNCYGLAIEARAELMTLPDAGVAGRVLYYAYSSIAAAAEL